MRSTRRSIVLFAVGNFLAALGGGTLLGMGSRTLSAALPQGSLQALLIGSVLGLLLLLAVKASRNRLARVALSWSCSAAAAFLLIIFERYGRSDGRLLDAAAYVFFAVLSCRYALS